jgi:hypothetical protein
LFIRNIHPRKTRYPKPKKAKQKFAVISFPTNFVTFSNKKLEFLRNFLILNLNKFIFGKLKEKKLYHKIGI